VIAKQAWHNIFEAISNIQYSQEQPSLITAAVMGAVPLEEPT